MQKHNSYIKTHDNLFYGRKYPSTDIGSCVSFIKHVIPTNILKISTTTNLAACVCVCVRAKFDQFLPARFYFESKRPENCVRIAKFPYAAFGPLFAFHCPLFFTRNNDLQCKSSRSAVVVSPLCGR